MTKAIEINCPIWINANFVPCNKGGQSPERELSGEYQNASPGTRTVAVSVGINTLGHFGGIQAYIIPCDETQPDRPDPDADWSRVAMTYVCWEAYPPQGENLFQSITFVVPMGWFYKVLPAGQIDVLHEWVEWNFYAYTVYYEE